MEWFDLTYAEWHAKQCSRRRPRTNGKQKRGGKAALMPKIMRVERSNGWKGQLYGISDQKGGQRDKLEAQWRNDGVYADRFFGMLTTKKK